MKISPRYDSEPIVRIDGEPTAVREPFLRQRRRFADALSTLTPGQWAAPSRCEGWRTQDVVAHLVGTDRFWNASIGSGVGGAPTRFLDGFDPKATPAAMVAAVSAESPSDTLASYLAASDALLATVESLSEGAWDEVAESPVGHVSVSAVVHHALWDSWVHERDVLVPLGMTPDQEPDEIRACLRYAAVLGPAFSVQGPSPRPGSMTVEVTAPDDRFIVSVGDDVRVGNGATPGDGLVVTGDAVTVLEAFSVRAPWPHPIADDQAWLVAGLTEVFETPVSS